MHPEDQDRSVQRLTTLLHTLERLMAIEAIEFKASLDQACNLVAEALGAEKIDAMLYEASSHTLVAVGSSKQPLSDKQHALGMARLALVNGGVEADVFRSGVPYITGQADQEPNVLRGVWEGLGVRSMLEVPLDVNGERRGVFTAMTTQPNAFTRDDLDFLIAVARYVGMVAHRAELVAHIAHTAAEDARRLIAEDLMNILAHDMSNLLTPVIGHLGILQMRALKENRTTDLTSITVASRRVDRLRRLLNDLLDLGRLERGLFSLALQPIDVVAQVRESVAVLQTASTPIEIRAPDQLIAHADADRFQQAIENLLTNAIAHNPDGVPVIIEIGSQQRESGPWANIIIRDSGPGIPSDLLPFVFERFVRGPSSPGLGLGLYLAHAIAEAHSGTLTVESAPGSGAAFCFGWPCESALPE